MRPRRVGRAGVRVCQPRVQVTFCKRRKGEVGSRLSSLAGAVLRERQGRFDKSQAELVGDSARLD